MASLGRSKKSSVHPHGCGERGHTPSVSHLSDGSSPRLWGTHWQQICPAVDHRFIPTAVGNATGTPSMSALATVQPHGCGERCLREVPGLVQGGSSPRLWGTPFVWLANLQHDRFIPTAVGNALISIINQFI